MSRQLNHTIPFRDTERGRTLVSLCRAPGMVRSAAIREALRFVGITLRQLSLRHGLTPNACSTTLSAPWARVEGIIAEALEVRPDELFPERYVDGRPIRRGVDWAETRREAVRRAS